MHNVILHRHLAHLEDEEVMMGVPYQEEKDMHYSLEIV
jgi:hypothetical protein